MKCGLQYTYTVSWDHHHDHHHDRHDHQHHHSNLALQRCKSTSADGLVAHGTSEALLVIRHTVSLQLLHLEHLHSQHTKKESNKPRVHTLHIAQTLALQAVQAVSTNEINNNVNEQM